MNSENLDKVFIIIPAYNAEATIKKVLSELTELYQSYQIVVVNDGSTDKTKQIVEDMGVKVLDHSSNQGYGQGVQTGVQYAKENGANYFVTIGADDQRDPKDVGNLLVHLTQGKSDIVIGSKFLRRSNDMPVVRKSGNRLMTFLFNFFYRSNLSDVTSGFRAFNLEISEISLGLSKSYSFDIDLYSEAILNDLSIDELAVDVYYSEHSSQMQNVFLVGGELALLIITKYFKFKFNSYFK